MAPVQLQEWLCKAFSAKRRPGRRYPRRTYHGCYSQGISYLRADVCQWYSFGMSNGLIWIEIGLHNVLPILAVVYQIL